MDVKGAQALSDRLGDDAPAERRIEFAPEDFDPILLHEGIDPASVTKHEWRKFTDAFLAGTRWDEIAGYAVEAIRAQRSDRAAD